MGVTSEGKGAPRQIGQFIRGEFMKDRDPGFAPLWEHSENDEGYKQWGTEEEAKAVETGEKPKKLTRQMAYMKTLMKDKDSEEAGAPDCALFNRGLVDKAYRADGGLGVVMSDEIGKALDKLTLDWVALSAFLPPVDFVVEPGPDGGE